MEIENHRKIRRNFNEKYIHVYSISFVCACVCVYICVKKEYDFLLYERRHNQNMRCSIFGFLCIEIAIWIFISIASQKVKKKTEYEIQ